MIFLSVCVGLNLQFSQNLIVSSDSHVIPVFLQWLRLANSCMYYIIEEDKLTGKFKHC